MPLVQIDARVPLQYLSQGLIEELSRLAPFGTGNPRPVFALAHLRIRSIRIVGKRQNVVRMSLQDEFGYSIDAVHFGDPEALLSLIREEYGERELQLLRRSATDKVDLAFTFYPEINEYMGQKSVQIVCMSYCRMGKDRV